VDNVSDQELITDVVLSNGNAFPAGPGNSYDNVVGGFTQNGITFPHVSAHLKSPGPTGGNISYKDGHVQWKKFNAAATTANNNPSKVRTDFNTPCFWW
jgi:hypothetical protein